MKGAPNPTDGKREIDAAARIAAEVTMGLGPTARIAEKIRTAVSERGGAAPIAGMRPIRPTEAVVA